MPANTAAPTRVLQLINTMNPDFGGPQEAAAQIGHSLKSLAIDSDIVTLDAPETTWGDTDVMRLEARSLRRIQLQRPADSLARARTRIATARSLSMVSGNTTGSRSGVRYAELATPYYVFAHGMLGPWFKREYPLKHLKKQLYWSWAEYRVLRDARAVLFTTEEERLLARQTFAPYRVNEAVVGFGISEPPRGERAHFLRRYPQLQDKRIALFLGRLHPKKGCDLLISAFATVCSRDPRLRLVMAGPDQDGYQAALMRQAELRGIADCICWTGMIKDELKWGAYQSAEVFVLPSHQEELRHLGRRGARLPCARADLRQGEHLARNRR